tara:strand:+ start:407 stop:763 length:357 start_codon:yes stop_codon:yes gene_type:complete
MLDSTTASIAKAVAGYEPCSVEEAEVQYPAKVNYNRQCFNPKDASTYPRTGSVYLDPYGVMRSYWIPSSASDLDLEGWYDVPTMGEMEEMCLDQAYTPAGDYVEHDHPDGWPAILGAI